MGSQSELQVFCRQVRSRSAEHQRAMALVFPAGLTSVAIGILRQELDSMVRVIYLLSIRDRAQRRALLSASVNGKKWEMPTPRGKRETVTDRKMVAIADADVGGGWVNRVYRFGCGFIHLSDLHDYQSRDPFLLLDDFDRESIIEQINKYHNGSLTSAVTLEDIVAYVPAIHKKIATNLEFYLGELERNGDLGERLLTG